MITALGHISGGHFNPAVTIAALFTKKIGNELGLLYIISQLLGGIFGAFLLMTAAPDSLWRPVDLGTPAVSSFITASNAVVIEAVLTFFLVFVIFGVAIDPRNQMKPVAGLAIGLTITLGVLMGGPLTGAAMNPARAFGPALLSLSWGDHLVYWIGPILGGVIAGLAYDAAFLQKPAKKEEGAPMPAPPTASEPPGTT